MPAGATILAGLIGAVAGGVGLVAGALVTALGRRAALTVPLGGAPADLRAE